MKLLLLHPTFWPMVGGVENVMRQHAEVLSSGGHEVRVITGHGQNSTDLYTVEVLKELSPGFPLNQQTKLAVDHGQTDQNLTAYTSLLQQVLTPHFAWADAVITHGALTTHFNFALTLAVWKLAETKTTVAWAHDLTATNKNYSLPNPGHLPWSLMRRAHTNVRYVAVSEQRRTEITSTFGLHESQVPVIENGLDLRDLLELTPPFYQWLAKIDFLSRDIIFFYPTKLLQRKNIDLAILFMDAIKKSGLKPLMLVSGGLDVYGVAGKSYEGYLKTFPEQLGLTGDVFFLNDYNDEIGSVWQQLYRVGDVLLFPSGYEGFGIPPYEASVARLPCWCQPLPTVPAWLAPAMTFVKTPEEAVAAAKQLTADPAYQARKKVWRELNWSRLYREKIGPFLESLKS